MNCGRYCLGHWGWKVRCQDILEQYKLLNHNQLLFKSAAQFIAKIIYHGQPHNIIEMIKLPNRKCKDLRMLKMDGYNGSYKADLRGGQALSMHR